MASEPIYGLRIQEVFQALETAPEGLSTDEALARKSLYGENRLSEQRKDPSWVKFLVHMMHAQALILAAVGVPKPAEPK